MTLCMCVFMGEEDGDPSLGIFKVVSVHIGKTSFLYDSQRVHHSHVVCEFV